MDDGPRGKRRAEEAAGDPLLDEYDAYSGKHHKSADDRPGLVPTEDLSVVFAAPGPVTTKVLRSRIPTGPTIAARPDGAASAEPTAPGASVDAEVLQPTAEEETGPAVTAIIDAPYTGINKAWGQVMYRGRQRDSRDTVIQAACYNLNRQFVASARRDVPIYPAGWFPNTPLMWLVPNGAFVDAGWVCQHPRFTVTDDHRIRDPRSTTDDAEAVPCWLLDTKSMPPRTLEAILADFDSTPPVAQWRFRNTINRIQFATDHLRRFGIWTFHHGPFEDLGGGPLGYRELGSTPIGYIVRKYRRLKANEDRVRLKNPGKADELLDALEASCYRAGHPPSSLNTRHSEGATNAIETVLNQVYANPIMQEERDYASIQANGMSYFYDGGGIQNTYSDAELREHEGEFLGAKYGTIPYVDYEGVFKGSLPNMTGLVASHIDDVRYSEPAHGRYFTYGNGGDTVRVPVIGALPLHKAYFPAFSVAFDVGMPQLLQAPMACMVFEENPGLTRAQHFFVRVKGNITVTAEMNGKVMTMSFVGCGVFMGAGVDTTDPYGVHFQR